MNKNLSGATVFGNYEDKYNTKNPISKALMAGFLRAFKKNIRAAGASGEVQSICEVGCGEGELLKILHAQYPNAALFASDISEGEVAKAQKNCAAQVHYSVQNAEDLSQYADNSFDLVVCCEVLEHLPNPQQGLSELMRIGKSYVLVSTPHEPIWRILNTLRGKYLQAFGNTPGHLNHWTVFQFSKFLQANPRVSVARRGYPFPWQMALIKKIS